MYVLTDRCIKPTPPFQHACSSGRAAVCSTPVYRANLPLPSSMTSSGPTQRRGSDVRKSLPMTKLRHTYTWLQLSSLLPFPWCSRLCLASMWRSAWPTGDNSVLLDSHRRRTMVHGCKNEYFRLFASPQIDG